MSEVFIDSRDNKPRPCVKCEEIVTETLLEFDPPEDVDVWSGPGPEGFGEWGVPGFMEIQMSVRHCPNCKCIIENREWTPEETRKIWRLHRILNTSLCDIADIYGCTKGMISRRVQQYDKIRSEYG